MKYAVASALLLLLLLVAGAVTGMIGFHYPVVVQDQPLLHPCKVTELQGSNLFLQDGRIVALDVKDVSEMSNKLSQAGFEVDIEGSGGSSVAVYGRQSGWVCGTPWAQPIRIPLFADTVFKNRRELIAVGDYVPPNSQQRHAADGSRTQSPSVPPVSQITDSGLSQAQLEKLEKIKKDDGVRFNIHDRQIVFPPQGTVPGGAYWQRIINDIHGAIGDDFTNYTIVPPPLL